MARTLINVPPKAKRGQIIEIKTLISHVMETGYRRSETGAAIPRDIINLFVCTYNGTRIGDVETGPEMNFSFFELLAHIVKTRSLTAAYFFRASIVVA